MFLNLDFPWNPSCVRTVTKEDTVILCLYERSHTKILHAVIFWELKESLYRQTFCPLIFRLLLHLSVSQDFDYSLRSKHFYSIKKRDLENSNLLDRKVDIIKEIVII